MLFKRNLKLAWLRFMQIDHASDTYIFILLENSISSLTKHKKYQNKHNPSPCETKAKKTIHYHQAPGQPQISGNVWQSSH